jgi:uncharacterized protein (TIGR02284 family)
MNMSGIVFKAYRLAFFNQIENTFLMATNDNLIEVLNDLIRINNDRIVGYERASQEARDIDVDLRSIFTRMGEESKQYAAELTQEVVKLGGEPATGTTSSGKIYRVWMDVKATFTGHDRQTVLNNCEFGEDAAQRAYESALESDADMSSDIRQLIANQKSSLKTSHDVIKKYRDMHKAVNETADDIRDVTNRNLR